MKFQSIDHLFEAFNSLKVLIVGDVMVDAYTHGIVERISPEAPVPVVRVKSKENRLGGAANVARNIKSLGAEPLLCAVIGEDSSGEEFLRLLEAENISTKGILKSPSRITTQKRRVLSGYQQMIRIDEESDEPLNAKDREGLTNHFLDLLKDTDVVLFQDYDKGVLDETTISRFLTKCEEMGKPTIVDPKLRNFKHYKNTSLFKPNLKEFCTGLNTSIDTSSVATIDVAVTQFCADHGHQKVMITLSDKGVYIADDSDSKLIPAHIRSISDVSGAGDTVVSIASLCLALNLDNNIIASISNLGGGLVCEQPGVVPIDKQKLKEETQALGLI